MKGGQKMLSREELEELTANSVDPKGWGPAKRDGHNSNLTDKQLVATIRHRNEDGVATFLLRQEYERRLYQRGL